MGSILLLFKVFIWLIIIQSIQCHDNHQSNYLFDSTGSLIVAEKLQMDSSDGQDSFRPAITNLLDTFEQINAANCSTSLTRLDDLSDYLKYVEIVFEALVILFTIQVYLLTKFIATDQVKGMKSFHDTQTSTRRAAPLSTQATTRKTSRSKVGGHPTGTRSKFFDAISHYFA